MFVELGIPRPGSNDVSQNRTWFNINHIVRVDVVYEKNKVVATVTSVKPGGSDRSIYENDDALRILEAIKQNKLNTQLQHEMPVPNENPVGPVVNGAATVKMVKR